MLLLIAACSSGPPPGDARPDGDADTGDSAPPAPDAWSDVPIVIGAGPAGLAVAMDLGGALVFEAADHVGGRALYASGAMFLVGTEEQAALGLVDTPALAEADWEALTGAPATDATRAFLSATGELRDRLVGMGLAFTLDRPTPGSGSLRGHLVRSGGAGLVRALESTLGEGVELRLSTPVSGLVFVDGAAAGVRTEAGWIGADTVVVASGGFVDRADLVELHTSWAREAWRSGNDYGAAGAALDWAEAGALGTSQLGAMGTYRDLIGVAGADGGAMQLEPGSGAPWVWVDGTGTRFIDESATWSVVLSGLADARANVWAITTRESIVPHVAADDAPFLVDGDAWRCAADVDALSEAIGVDATGLANTMAAVAEIQAGSASDPLGRPRETFNLEAGAPCAFRPGNVAAKNFGGLAVDGDGRVLDASGAVVPGLWAVGEAAGMGAPGLGGAWGFDGSLSAVVWSGWRTAAAIGGEGSP